MGSKKIKQRVSHVDQLPDDVEVQEQTSSGERKPKAGVIVRRLFGMELEAGELNSLLLLMLLYTLQGVPMGLSSSISFILQEKGASYADQGTFSLASWPFSLKILWAPLVDALYFERFGQRRTWLLPLQTLVGILLLYMSSSVGTMLGEEGTTGIHIRPLTALFFATYFLLASQDIAVDGWAITMLSRRNVGLASTVNAAGQTAGFFISFTGFLILNSFELVTLSGFVGFWGVVFLLSATCVFLKREKKDDSAISVAAAYCEAGSVVQLSGMWPLSLVMLTRSAAFAAAESLFTLKLLEKGVPKQHMATVSALLMPFNILLPVVASKWTAGPRPLDSMMATYPVRTVLTLGAAGLVALAPSTLGGDSSIPVGYYLAVFIWLACYSAVGTLHFVGTMAFFSRVSDPTIGGTYMTMLNTINNLGSKWCNSLVLYMFDALNTKVCKTEDGTIANGVDCLDGHTEACKEIGGRCISANDDAFHMVIVGSLLMGLAWVLIMKHRVKVLQDLPIESWRVSSN